MKQHRFPFHIISGYKLFWNCLLSSSLSSVFLILLLSSQSIAQCPVLPASVVDNTSGFTVEGVSTNDFAGHSVSDAGDINGDGLSDILIGAYLSDDGSVEDAGEAYVIFGSADFSLSEFDLLTLDGSNGFVVKGNTKGSKTGTFVSSAGDINGDDLDDILIGAYNEVFLIYGSSSDFPEVIRPDDLDGTNGSIIKCEETSIEVNGSSAGDINGDGMDDIIISASSSELRFAVIYGSATFPSLLNINELNTDNTSGFIAESNINEDGTEIIVSDAGDINRDGFDDIIAGAPAAEVNGIIRAGKAFIIYGKNTLFTSPLDLNSLDGNGGFLIQGDNENTRLGSSVSAAGDFNDDGTDDFVIGAWGNYEGLNNNGAACIVYGRNTGFPSVINLSDLNTDERVIIKSRQDYTRLGSSVSPAGDFNSDGISDILIGAQNNGSNSERSACIIFGNSNLQENILTAEDINGRNGFVLYEGNFRHLFANSLSNLGDVNADGADDIIIGTVPASDYYGEAGRSHIIYGETLDYTDEEAPVIDCPGNQTLVEGTTLPDYKILFYSRVEDNCDELLYINQSPARGTEITDGMEVTVTVRDKSGNHTICTFAINLKTPTERVCPAPLDVSQLNGHNGTIFTSPYAETHGATMATGIGDINHDGIDDIGTSFDRELLYEEEASLSEIYVVYGSDSGFPPSSDLLFMKPSQGFKFIAPNTSVELTAIENTGDLNKDGLNDLIISSNNELFVVFGVADGFPDIFDLNSLNGSNGFVIETIHDRSIFKIGPADDLNGDGISDLIAGASQASPNGKSNAGQIYVLYGSGGSFPAAFDLNTLNGSNGFMINGISAGDNAGRALSVAGDINNDGYNDLVIGAPRVDVVDSIDRTGQAYLIFGAAKRNSGTLELSSLDGTNGFTMDGVTEGFLGSAVSGGFDLNADGVSDFVVSSPQATPDDGDAFSSGAGVAYLIFGKSSAFDASIDLRSLNGENGLYIYGDSFIGQSGFSMSAAGDFNNDGYDDLVLGAPYGNSGEVNIIYGKDGDWNKIFDIENINGINGLKIVNFKNYIGVSPSLGSNVNAAGDFNGDGISDLVLRSYPEPGFSESWGWTFVIFGHGQLDQTAPAITCPGEQTLKAESLLPDYTDLATVTDNCDEAPVVSQSPEEGAEYTPGMTVTLTAEDISGNSSACSFIVTENQDTEPPVLDCPENQLLSCDDEQVPDYTTLVEVNDDKDPNPYISQDPESGTPVTAEMTITITAGDASGNTSSCSFNISKEEDTNSPEITCIEDQTLASEALLPDYTSMVQVTDDCDTKPSVTQSPAPGTTFTEKITITLTAEDASGNKSSCTFSVTEIADTEAPDISCPEDQLIACDASTVPDFTAQSSVTDNTDSDPLVYQSPEAGAPVTDGMAITITAEDASGNTSSCSFDISKEEDTNSPEITCIKDQTLASEALLPDYTSMVQVTDDCDTNPSVTQSPAPGTTFTEDITVTITAKDANENTGSCTFTVEEVPDTEAPVIDCQNNRQISCNAQTIPDFTTQLTVADNVTTPPVVTQSPLAGTVFTEGMTITVRAEDVSGNFSSCSFVLNSHDSEPPSVSKVNNQVLTIEENCKAVLPDYTGLVDVNDNCSEDISIKQSPESGTLISETTTITLTASDENNNRESVHFQVSLQGNNFPTINAGQDVTIVAGESIRLSATSPNNGSIEWFPDNGLSQVNVLKPNASPANTTTYTVILTAKNGCTAEDQVTVTVADLLFAKGMSPDNDGINDIWEIRGITRYPNNEVVIYNRWGDVVFAAENYNNRSSVFKGEANRNSGLGAGKLPEGTYFYSIRLSPDEAPLKGFLVLKR